MVTLRATQKVLRLLPPTAPETAAADTALGDWYVNRITSARQPLLLLVSSRSLLPMLAPARDVRSLPERLPQMVAERLARHGVPQRLIVAETQAMAPVAVAKTCDRSVVGTMVEYAHLLQHYLRDWGHDEAGLWAVEAHLAHTPCRVTKPGAKGVWPDLKATELLHRICGGPGGAATTSPL